MEKVVLLPHIEVRDYLGSVSRELGQYQCLRHGHKRKSKAPFPKSSVSSSFPDDCHEYSDDDSSEEEEEGCMRKRCSGHDHANSSSLKIQTTQQPPMSLCAERINLNSLKTFKTFAEIITYGFHVDRHNARPAGLFLSLVIAILPWNGGF
jgi:hypothetical protein